MFNNQKSTEEPRRSMAGGGATTTIAAGVKVEGEFTSQGDVLIEGEVHGTLVAGGMLTVGPEAKIKADVRAGDALISGTVEGNIAIMKRCEIKTSAKVLGDIVSDTLAIEAGAQLSGRVQIGMKTASEPPTNGRRGKTESASLES